MFIKFFKYCYFNQQMFIRLLGDFSGGGATIREGALIKGNTVFKLSSAYAFDLDQSNIFWFSKEVTHKVSYTEILAFELSFLPV